MVKAGKGISGGRVGGQKATPTHIHPLPPSLPPLKRQHHPGYTHTHPIPNISSTELKNCWWWWFVAQRAEMLPQTKNDAMISSCLLRPRRRLHLKKWVFKDTTFIFKEENKFLKKNRYLLCIILNLILFASIFAIILCVDPY